MRTVDVEVAGVYGFKFSTPVPLPQLGHRARFGTKVSDIPCGMDIELVPLKPRFGGVSFSGNNIAYHEHDRFGLYAYSRIELRLHCSIARLLDEEIFAIMNIDAQDGASLEAIVPGVAGEQLCVELFNRIVDLQTAAFSTYWTPHVTPGDIHERTVMNWSSPQNSNSFGFLTGVATGHKYVWKKPGFGSPDPSLLRKVLADQPIMLWEEIIQTALRDLAVGRIRSALMHACLGVEAFMREVVRINNLPGRDPYHEKRTFWELGTKRGCIPAVLGYRLDSNCAANKFENSFAMLRALRDCIMHTGEMIFEIRSGDSVNSINCREDPEFLVQTALDFIHGVSDELRRLGYSGGARSLTPVKHSMPMLESISSV